MSINDNCCVIQDEHVHFVNVKLVVGRVVTETILVYVNTKQTAMLIIVKKCISENKNILINKTRQYRTAQIAKFMGPTWGPPGSSRPQMGPMFAPWTLLSG